MGTSLFSFRDRTSWKGSRSGGSRSRGPSRGGVGGRDVVGAGPAVRVLPRVGVPAGVPAGVKEGAVVLVPRGLGVGIATCVGVPTSPRVGVGLGPASEEHPAHRHQGDAREKSPYTRRPPLERPTLPAPPHAPARTREPVHSLDTRVAAKRPALGLACRGGGAPAGPIQANGKSASIQNTRRIAKKASQGKAARP